ncbi:MAG: secretory protein, partial [Chitinophagaceae bacterium]
HEVMHIVQSYNDGGEGWLTEGIADYVRFKFGVNNEKGNWSLPAFKQTQSYTNSYRVTARFLVWLEKHVRKSIVNEMDAASREGKYTPGLWKQLTGKTVDELWSDYAANPEI